jgi:hypothetical protein
MMDGDLVIIYERHDSMTHLYLEKGKIFQNKHVNWNKSSLPSSFVKIQNIFLCNRAHSTMMIFYTSSLEAKFHREIPRAGYVL